MTLTIELPPNAEGELARRAEDLGMDTATLASLLLQDRLRGMAEDDVAHLSADERAETMESVRRSEGDVAEGRVRSIEQIRREKAQAYGLDFNP